jgi:hypothetical protein
MTEEAAVGSSEMVSLGCMIAQMYVVAIYKLPENPCERKGYQRARTRESYAFLLHNHLRRGELLLMNAA